MLIARSVHPLPGEAERKARLLSLIDSFGGRRVLVVGDLIADEFIYGEVHRVSREAPVLILKYDATEIVAGGAGNAANNVAALGGSRHACRHGRRGRARDDGCWRASRARWIAGRSCARKRLPHAGQDANSRRRHSFGEAADRAHRSRGRLAARRSGQPRVRRASSAQRSASATPCCCRTTVPVS